MTLCLEALPIDLIEHIVTPLDLSGIASLRLTSRPVQSKAFRVSFTAFFKNKDVELTKSSPQAMVRSTSQGRLGCLLQHCTVIDIATDTARS